MELTSTETILAIANVIFVIIAIFLFVRLRKNGKSDTEKKQLLEMADISNITQDEFKPEMFGIQKQDIAPFGKPSEAVSDVKTGREEKNAFALEDELPEVEEKPEKKESKKKKAAKKILEEFIGEAIVKETGVQPEKEEKPEKKERKKKKPAKKEPEKTDAIKEKTVAPPEKIVIPEKIEFNFEEPIPEKEEKPEKKEGKTQKTAGLKVKTGVRKGLIKEKKVEEKAAKKPSKKKT